MPLLVFSNACQSSMEETWRADDPGRVFGLANAFLLSGVKYYIGTQWEVVDAQSQAFARAFYTELGRGRTIGSAVRRARESVIVAEGEGGLGWAGYVLYGDPSYAPLAVEDSARAAQPVMPTPADIVARESIKGVVKKITRPPSSSNVRGPVSGEITASANNSAAPTVIVERERTDPVAAGRRVIPVSWWIAGAAVILAAVLAGLLFLRGL
jgi:hypothetical protein